MQNIPSPPPDIDNTERLLEADEINTLKCTERIRQLATRFEAKIFLADVADAARNSSNTNGGRFLPINLSASSPSTEN
jgi:hypothetical protein